MLVQALQAVGSVRKGDWFDLPETEAHSLTAAGAVRPVTVTVTVTLTAPGAILPCWRSCFNWPPPPAPR